MANDNKQITGSETADLQRMVSGLVTPEKSNIDEDVKVYRPPSTSRNTRSESKNHPSKQSGMSNKDKDYEDFMNRTSAENKREAEALQQRRDTKRLERENAAVTVKNPTRSGSLPNERKMRKEKKQNKSEVRRRIF